MDKKRLEKKIKEGNGTFKDLHDLSMLCGRELSATVMAKLREEYSGRDISDAEARKLVRPILMKSHAYISEMAAAVIDAMYQEAGVGLKAVIPEYNAYRENEIVKEIVDWSRANEADQE
jgi:hypothetical protein